MMGEPANATHRNPWRSWLWVVALVLGQVLCAALGLPSRLLLALLLGASASAAAIVLFEAMHLRRERRSLALAILPIVTAFVLLLSAMFPDGFRAGRMRAVDAGRTASETR